MSSYLSNILTNTTSKYNSLRQNLLSDEKDGDTEDDSHLCRALRAYYTEQGRGFPQWLPPDPKRSAPPLATTASFTSSLRQPNNPQQASPVMGSGSRGTLSDLWDAPKVASPQQPMSLRRQAQERGNSSFQGREQRGGDGGLAAPRPLPSQRAGSYQSNISQHSSSEQSPPSSSGGERMSGGGTAQERLKARLWGSGRSTSPAPSPGGAGAGAGDRGGRFARPPGR